MSGRGPRWITKPTFTVQLTGTPVKTYGYVTVDGTAYTAETVLQVDRHQTISITVSGYNSTQYKSCEITQNGEIVQSGAGTYTFNVESDVVINFVKHGTSMPYCTCSITTK